jgi:hypothetical protein
VPKAGASREQRLPPWLPWLIYSPGQEIETQSQHNLSRIQQFRTSMPFSSLLLFKVVAKNAFYGPHYRPFVKIFFKLFRKKE